MRTNWELMVTEKDLKKEKNLRKKVYSTQKILAVDLPEYIETKVRVNNEYKDRRAFGYKCLMNTANCGKFSSDRTILEYARELWKVK